MLLIIKSEVLCNINNMEKEYFYLAGKDQKGPFRIEQFKNIELESDTLIWFEGLDNWVQAKEVGSLKEFIKKIPTPPPIIDNTHNTSETERKNFDEKNNLLKDSNVKFWASFKIYFFSIFLIGLAIIFSFAISNHKKQNLKNKIYSKIENILSGKTVVLDGTYSLTQGELEESGYGSKSKGDEFFQPWWERDKLYTIYKASYGGFTIKQLTKQYQDGYDIETYSSGDMGYKNPTKGPGIERIYYDPKSGKEYTMKAYVNSRLAVRECYSKTFKYFTFDDRYSPGAYTPGKLIDITNFRDLRNEFYYISNSQPKQYTSSGLFLSSWHTSDEHSTNINTDDWVVYYSTSGRHYVIEENEKATKKFLFKYLGISVGSIIILLIILSLSKPKYFCNLRLYGKRWKNASYSEQIFFFEHSFFRKHIFIEINDDKVSKGVLKLSDRGDTLNLSYPNKELFYKIVKIDADNLTINSIKDKIEISFIRIGAKVNSEINNNSSETAIEESIIKKR